MDNLQRAIDKRLPPGQHLTAKFPVLHAGNIPEFDESQWEFKTWGLCENTLNLDINDLKSFKRVKIVCDIHCVTRWSKFDTVWEGVKAKDLVDLSAPSRQCKYVLVHAENSFTTNLPVALLLEDNVIFADKYDNKPLTPEHGSPMRLIVPQRYFWKSAKWVTGIEFTEENIPGYWEKHGYHLEGDPWKEERYCHKVPW